jgi:hypothetical protein
MDDIADLLTRGQDAGIAITTSGDRLRVSGPKADATVTVARQLLGRKAEVMAYLGAGRRLLYDLRQQRYRVGRSGGRLVVHPPPAEEQREAIRRHKPAILAVLQAEAAPLPEGTEAAGPAVLPDDVKAWPCDGAAATPEDMDARPGEALYVARNLATRIVTRPRLYGLSYWRRERAADGTTADRCYYQFGPAVFAWLLAAHRRAEARLASLAQALARPDLQPAERDRLAAERDGLSAEVARGEPRLRALRAVLARHHPGIDLGQVTPRLPPQPEAVHDPWGQRPEPPPPPPMAPAPWSEPDALELARWVLAVSPADLPEAPARLCPWLILWRPREWLQRLQGEARAGLAGKPESSAMAFTGNVRQLRLRLGELEVVPEAEVAALREQAERSAQRDERPYKRRRR